ncbi:MAG: 6-phosphofructokinase [Candidatus Omnitrophica bacterium]|nr:6-phosphofructokinase [Candidatus Omnitrophota bacterium]
MAGKLKGNMLIAQSGGPTVVINQSLVGAIMEAKKHPEIQGIYGALNGIKGVLKESFVNLRKEPVSTLRAVARTPSSALGTVRQKPSNEECEKIFQILMRYDIRYFFYIGGNDSAETTFILNENAKRVNYEFRCFHIPKTIDNDLRENDHTPGYGSAARFVALAIMGDNLDNLALPGVKIDVIMGRHAGFLTAASALARQYQDDGPHLIYLPERAFSLEQFLSDVQTVYSRLGRCVVAVSEGICDADNTPIVVKLLGDDRDSFNNPQLSGTGALGDALARAVKEKTKISRVRADTFGYLQRSFPEVISEVDAKEAREVAEMAVKTAVKADSDGSVAIRRLPGKKYRVTYEIVPLASVAKETRHMPDEFINLQGNDITEKFLDYARPLVGQLPKMARLKKYPVRQLPEKKV